MWTCDTLRLNTLLIPFQLTGEEYVSESESNVSVLKQGNKPIIHLRFGFVLKLGCVNPVSTIGRGMGPRFVFRFLKRGPDTDEPLSIHNSYYLYYLLSFLLVMVMPGNEFPTFLGDLKSCVAMPFLTIIN